MKKILLLFILPLLLVFSTCGSNETKEEENNDTQEGKAATFIYESETGPVEVPVNPQRIIMLSGFTGNVIHLGGNLVGVDVWSKSNPTFD